VILVGRKTALDKYLLLTNYIAAVAFEFSLFSNLLINDYYEYFWSFYPRAGILHPLYLLILLVTSLRTFYLLLSTLNSEREFSNSRYYQIKYVCWATFFYLFAASDFLLNYGVEFYPIGFLFILVFMGITAYAMIRHRLMDIKIVLKYSSVYVLSFLIISFLAVFFNYFNKPDSGIFTEANIAIIIILVVLFPYVKKYLYRLANKYFFTSLYDSNKIISDLSFRLRSTLELDYMYESIYDCVDSAFHPESFGFLIYNSEKNLYSFKYKQGKFKNIPDSFKGSFKLHQHYTKKNKVALSSELQNSDDLSFSAIGKVFEKLNIEALVPVNIKWRNIGLLALGQKQTRDIYTNQDIELLEITGGLGATAIENGDLYKNINAKNIELENLLKVKTDFLRIANHQLNTPLSIMKLAYDSVDEKTYSVEEGFSMAREGLSRLSSVVAQLWIVLDIESGSLYLRNEVVNLIDLYNEVLKGKRESSQIKNKNLQIILKVPKEQKFFVFVSRQKVKEVFSALFENAVS
jgi:K+-sensing histidine kinase KdpD